MLGQCVAVAEDLTLIGVFACPSPNGEGMGLTSFLSVGLLGFQVKAWKEDGFSPSPLGDIVPER